MGGGTRYMRVGSLRSGVFVSSIQCSTPPTNCSGFFILPFYRGQKRARSRNNLRSHSRLGSRVPGRASSGSARPERMISSRRALMDPPTCRGRRRLRLLPVSALPAGPPAPSSPRRRCRRTSTRYECSAKLTQRVMPRRHAARGGRWCSFR